VTRHGGAGPVGAVLRAKVRMGRHALASVRGESKLKVGVVTVAAALLWLGAFYAFHEGLRWLGSFDVSAERGTLGIGDIIVLRLLSVFTLALFVLLTFSNVLITFATVYRAAEVRYLVQAPLSARQFFLARFAECLVFSSWASAYIGSPLILAYGLTTGAPWPFYGAAVLFYVPFVTVPGALGACITLLAVWVYPRVSKWVVAAAGAVVLGATVVYMRGVLNAVRLAEDSLVSSGLAAIGAVTRQTQAAWLPSYWTSQGLLAASMGRYGDSAFHFLLLLAHALLLTWLATELAQGLFYRGYAGLEAMGGRRTRRRWSALDAAERALRRLPEPARSLVVKDVRLFWRDPTQWLQFVVFFGVMAVYTATLRNRELGGSPHYAGWVAAMNIGACTLILATLTSRFVFPLVSLEGRRFWILGLAPITLRQIVWQKFWLSAATTTGFTLALVVLSCLRLGVAPLAFALAVYSILLANFSLAGLAVGLGSLYPNFHEDNPARIVSGMGGTLNFLLSLGYIALVVAAETVILQWDALAGDASANVFWWALAGVFVFLTVLSLVAALVPMKLGLRNLAATEF
jgi:ABC-2 type transport system permease protein